MIDGKYKVSIDSPMGVINGVIGLKTNGDSLSGYIEAMGTKNEFTGGKLIGNKCTFTGQIKTILGSIQYNVTGEVNGDVLDITANTNKGNFMIQGKRTS